MKSLILDSQSLFFKLYLTIFNYLPINTCELIKKSALLAILIIPLTLFSLPYIALSKSKRVKLFVSKYLNDGKSVPLIYATINSILLYIFLFISYSILFTLYNLIFRFTVDPHQFDPFNKAATLIGLTLIITAAIIFIFWLIFNKLPLLINYMFTKKSKSPKAPSTLTHLYKNLKEKTCSKITYI